jgi:putative heme-binding domain-containing protein
MRIPLLALAGALFVFIQPCRAEWKQVAIPTQEILAGEESAWFRCFIRVPDNMVTPAQKDLWRDSVTFSVGGIRGPFAISINGREVGRGDAFAADQRRRFKVPKDILEKKAFNVFAIELTGTAIAGGIPAAPILAGYFDELELAGAWQMHRGKPADADLAPLKEQPAIASFTETGFRPSSTPLAADTEFMPGARLAPSASLAQMKTAEDLAVDLILSEPQVAQPTHISFDERGRMWVTQYRQYPYPAGVKMISRDKYYRGQYDRVPPAPPNHDRGADIISVHEDTDGDGTFDSYRNVLEGLNMANAVVRGHGGIWVMHSPYLLFYPDANGDDVPDRAPEVRLAGFGLEDTHSVANGLVWGPDGWLYGAQGSTVTSRVVRPGIDPPGFEGVYHENCMVWRYHPRTTEYEIFAEGGGNIFGLEFDSEGRLFSGHNGGDTRGWHYLQGGLFLKQGVDPGKFGPQGNAFAFGHLDQMKSRNPIPRFSHATIVADGTAIPQHYQGRFFAADPLARNVMISERYARGSTFETSDSGTALAGADPAFRPVFMTNAPDGSVYLADFYEEFIAHGQNYQGQLDPSTGRIYRIRGRDAPLRKDGDLSRKTPRELIETLSHPNRWHRHTAVRLLAERADQQVVPALRDLLAREAPHPSLEALWVLGQVQALDEETARVALRHPNAPVRAWAVRLLGDQRKLPGGIVEALSRLIETEADAEVRAQIAATASRLPAVQAIPLIAAILKRDADLEDPYIPMLCWWALERHCASERDSVIAAIPWNSKLAQQSLLPRLMRRFAATGARQDLLTCAALLKAAPGAPQRKQLMVGFEDAFKGRTPPAFPEELVAALAESGLASRYLRVRLGDSDAINEALKIVSGDRGTLEDRLMCVRLFGEVKVGEAAPALLALVQRAEPAELRKAALTSLLRYDGPEIGEKLVKAYPMLPPDLQPAAQTLLTSRVPWTIVFLRAIEAGSIDKGTVSTGVASVLQGHDNRAVADLARRVLSTPALSTKPQHQAEQDRIRGLIAAAPGDPYKGEAIYLQRCSACHTLFHKGGRIGPDLTPYQRNDLGTMLTSILDPSAEIREGFVNQFITTSDGRSLSGFVTDQDNAVVVIRGFDGQDVSISRAEIRELKADPTSLMPEGLLNGLTDQELRDFFAYLRIPQPITR